MMIIIIITITMLLTKVLLSHWSGGCTGLLSKAADSKKLVEQTG